MQLKKDRWIFLIYILGFLTLALTLALFQPLADSPPLYGNPPDEHARYLVPRYICEHGVLPTGFEEEIRIPTYGFSYALYNVFPYIIQGYVMRFVNLFTDSELLLLYTARVVNVISGVLMAFIVYLLSRRLFKDRRFRWLFCFAVMYLPQNLFLHTYVNTDSMCLLSTAMMLYGLVCAWKEGFSAVNCIWLSGGIILCALSYYNAYGYILSSILLFLLSFLDREKGRWSYDWKQMFKKGIFISVLVLAGIGWWFVRSYLLYDGDFLGLDTRQQMAAQYAEASVNPLSGNTFQQRGYTILQMMQEKKFAECVFYSFVAAFGSVSITGNIWLYRFYKVFLVGGLAGCCLIWNRKKKDFALVRGKKMFFHANMIFCIIMPILLLIRYAYTMDYQDQGRYILPAVIPLMFYVTEGFRKWTAFPKIPDKLRTVFTILLLIALTGGTVWMVYGKALPVYLTTGVVLQ